MKLENSKVNLDDGRKDITNSNDMEDINNFIELKRLQNRVLKKIMEIINKSKENKDKNNTN